ncbi:hypothetical protein WI25_14395 [Burkholderia cepacia]|nr:hypothetical protein WI25_14395 [Burkholderia cepacia]
MRGLLLALRGHIGHALRLHLDPARTLRITYRHKLQSGLGQFLIRRGHFPHQLGPRLDFQQRFVFLVQFFRTRTALIDEVLQVRPREHFEMQQGIVRLRWYRTRFHRPLILADMRDD